MSEHFHVVLYQPVIPQNTGSIARLCACTGATLHLIHPLGFDVDEAAVKRAGLDYWPHVDVREHKDWQAFIDSEQPQALYLFSKFSNKNVYEASFSTPSYFVFGSETKGLPPELHETYSDQLYLIPIRKDIVRSLNLSHSAAIVLFEAIRQTKRFPSNG